MNKRIISFLLAIAITCSCAIYVGAEEYTEKSVIVCHNLTYRQMPVFLGGDGTVYAPLSWLTEFGDLVGFRLDDQIVYRYTDQKDLGSYTKRIFINTKDNGFEAAVYFSAGAIATEIAGYYETILSEEGVASAEAFIEKYVDSVGEFKAEARKRYEDGFKTIYRGKFSNKISINDTWYVPVEELLPLLNATVEIHEGVIYIAQNPVSIYQALGHGSVGSIVFDSEEDIWGAEFMNTTGYVIDTIMEKRFDRLSVFSIDADTRDYEAIFSNYLVDNETFLSAFDEEMSPVDWFLFDADTSIGLVDTANTWYETGYNIYESMTFYEVTNSEFFSLIEVDNTFGTGMTGGGSKLSDILEIIKDVYNYGFTYFNQVEDHRQMLGAVYDYYLSTAEKTSDKLSIVTSPSYIAAHNIQELYNTQCSGDLMTTVGVGLRDALYKAARDYASKVIVKVAPWTLAIDITKPIMDYLGVTQTVNNAAVIDLHDNICALSYQVYTQRRLEQKLDSESLDEIRLSALMALISSKTAYDAYWLDSGHEEDKKAIKDMLTYFYLAADSVECESTGYYEKTHRKLAKQLGDLDVREKAGVGIDQLPNLYELGMMSFEDLCAIEWSNCDIIEETDPETGAWYARVIATTQDMTFTAVYEADTADHGISASEIYVLDLDACSEYAITSYSNIGLSYYYTCLYDMNTDLLQSGGGFAGIEGVAVAEDYWGFGYWIEYYFDGVEEESTMVGAKITYTEKPTIDYYPYDIFSASNYSYIEYGEAQWDSCIYSDYTDPDTGEWTGQITSTSGTATYTAYYWASQTDYDSSAIAVRIFDSGATSGAMITPGIYIGMTYEQVSDAQAELSEIYTDAYYDELGYATATADFWEEGFTLDFYFNGTNADAVLIGANLSYYLD